MIDNKEEFSITGAETSISGFELIGIRMINQLTEFQARTFKKLLLFIPDIDNFIFGFLHWGWVNFYFKKPKITGPKI